MRMARPATRRNEFSNPLPTAVRIAKAPKKMRAELKGSLVQTLLLDMQERVKEWRVYLTPNENRMVENISACPSMSSYTLETSAKLENLYARVMHRLPPVFNKFQGQYSNPCLRSIVLKMLATNTNKDSEKLKQIMEKVGVEVLDPTRLSPEQVFKLNQETLVYIYRNHFNSKEKKLKEKIAKALLKGTSVTLRPLYERVIEELESILSDPNIRKGKSINFLSIQEAQGLLTIIHKLQF